MANYNTFIVIDTHIPKVALVTSSAHKAARMLEKGKRVEVWNENRMVRTVYFSDHGGMGTYLAAESLYWASKQDKAELRNAIRKVLRA